TFHAICARFLRFYGERIGVPRSFVIYDDKDSLEVLKDCMKELRIPEELYPPRALATCIDAAKNDGLRPAAYARRELDFMGEKAALVYPRYEQKLAVQGALDFGDLIL